jgi:hypothetical protein
MDWKLVEYCKQKLDIVSLFNEHSTKKASQDRPTKIYCPFHDDVNKKSANIYPSSDEIYCFTNKNVFGPYDILSELDGLSDEEIKNKVGYEPDGVKFDVKKQVSNQEVANIQRIKHEMVKKFPAKFAGQLLSQVVNTDNMLKVV